MLHIKDIEAFAHINEALAGDTKRPEGGEGGHVPAVHPAMMLAMMATGRLKPYREPAGDDPAQAGTESGTPGEPPQASVAGMMTRMFFPRGR